MKIKLFKDRNDLKEIINMQRERLSEMKVELQNARSWKWTGVDSDEDPDYKGNHYQTYEEAVEAIVKKYEAVADWGCVISGNIIEFRASVIMSAPLEPNFKEETSERDIAWTEEFMKVNGLDSSYAVECAKETEIEGRFLVKMLYDEKHKWTWVDSSSRLHKEEGIVKVRFLTWENNPYTVKVSKSDYTEYDEIKFEDESTKALKKDFFVYRKFGGRIDKPNIPVMKIWRVLDAIEGLDKALADLRLINWIYAGPIADVECDTKQQAKDVMSMFPTNFKKRKFFVHVGKFKYVSPESAGIEILIKEIAVLTKVISGSTQVPVQILGFTDELSNRSTAESLVDSLNASVQTERGIMISGWNEVLKKSAKLQSGKDGMTTIDEDKLSFTMNQITREQWEILEKIFIELKKEDFISLRTLLERVPNLDVEQEIERLKSESDEALRLTKEMSDSEDKTPIDNNEIIDENGVIDSENKGGTNAEEKR